ncbi:MAG: site-specific DNA-methyltransferase [Halobacteriota archaeon]
MTENKPDNKEIEQYDHKGKERVNIPPVGLVTPETDPDIGQKSYSFEPHLDPALGFDSQRNDIEIIISNGLNAERLEDAKAALYELQRRQEPYLNWAGKAEHTSFEERTVSLHVHERIDPLTIIQALRKKEEKPTVQLQLSFFEGPDENPPLREAIEFYKHKHQWSNRLIAGDSLLVMNSLLEKEGMAGSVQMIYIDPPYGIKYGSNFQPFVNKRDVKDGKDEDLSQEPETIKAFRDTWELGIHSYLTYLRDRLLLARELLSQRGSLFVQISDKNLHHLREILDEVFGKNNQCPTIVWKKASPESSTIRNSFNYIVWYAKDLSKLKVHRLFKVRTGSEGSTEDPRKLPLWADFPDGSTRPLKTEEKRCLLSLPDGTKVFRITTIVDRTEDRRFPFLFDGKEHIPKRGYGWRGNPSQMERLKIADRIVITPEGLGYKFYLEDYPFIETTNLWDDTSGRTQDMIYAVQTNAKIIERCVLLSTDPGDLVLDPTCGSGTTAYVAEKWGRRWITCDTSRVAIALAKQRLMTAVFEYYELAYPEEGVSGGFHYKTVPHITLKSIAKNSEITEGLSRPEIDRAVAKSTDKETLYDQPLVDNTKVRITGPFTIEAVPSPVVKPLMEIGGDQVADASLTRSGETLRQREWRDELFRTGIITTKGQRIKFSRVEPLPGTRYLQADAETIEDDPKRAVISFGPEHAPLEQRQVALAIEESLKLVPEPKIVVFASFHFDPEAAKDIDETAWPGVTLLKVQMNADLLTEDLKKKRASNESFWLIGQPDVRLKPMNKGANADRYQVEVLGFDYYNTLTGNVESGGADKIAMWMLDTDYDGRSLFPRQVFFPLADKKGGWSRLALSLKAELNIELVEAYKGTVSLPFKAGDNKQIAVKIIDDRGIESLKIVEVD